MVLVAVYCFQSNMAVFVIFVAILSLCHWTQAADSLHLRAVPHQIIPGLTPSLEINCSPGPASNDYRQVYFIQILSMDSATPLATLQPDKAPEIGVSNQRVTAQGQLGSGISPRNSNLTVNIDTPLTGGTVVCRIVGLGNSGNEITHTDSINITEHPESSLVHDVLKNMVLGLKREAENLLQQTQLLQLENLRLSQLTNAKRQALTLKEATLRQLTAQVESARNSVDAEETLLNVTAPLLDGKIANVSRDAPPERVAFNAVERTERTYASGHQVMLETALLNDGNGYNSTTSVFEPPVAGVYYFTFAQLAHDSAAAAYRSYSIRLNATVLSSAYNGDDRQSSTYQHSNTGVVVKLTPADKITVIQQYSTDATTQLTAYGSTPNGICTNFAGYILY